MTAQIVYRNFQQAQAPEVGVTLTAQTLSRGRRRIKAANALNAMLNGVCLLLCGVCIAVSILILVYLTVGG